MLDLTVEKGYKQSNFATTKTSYYRRSRSSGLDQLYETATEARRLGWLALAFDIAGRKGDSHNAELEMGLVGFLQQNAVVSSRPSKMSYLLSRTLFRSINGPVSRSCAIPQPLMMLARPLL